MKMQCAVDEVGLLSPSELRATLDKDKEGEFLLLDVRQPEEYESGHIPGAILIPLGELEARQQELDRSKRIITYCRSGRRGMAAAVVLCGLGFHGLQSVEGGMLDWPYETIPGMPPERPDLISDTSAVGDILMLAMRMEKGAGDFYRAAAQKAELSPAREMYQQLAAVEDGHMHRLYARAVALLGTQTLPPLHDVLAETKLAYMEGGIEISPALARVHEDFATELEALEIAVEKEFMSYDFYKRASALVADRDAKGLLAQLAVDERNHADTLLKRLSQVVRQ